MLLLSALLPVVTAGAQNAADGNEGCCLSLDRVNGTCTLNWWGKSGKTYFIEQSNDLTTWHYVPAIRSGSDQILEWVSPLSTDHLFLRLRHSDIVCGNPFTADFDSDGLDNYAELQAGLDPFVSDAGNDPDGDGLTNAEEYGLGTRLDQPAVLGSGQSQAVGLVVHTEIY